MGSIVMDNCHIGSNCIIAAGAVVLENTKVEPGVSMPGAGQKSKGHKPGIDKRGNKQDRK
jgi:carbonic anhydrase/acetyltransferase-like protein (isoleucine patch superfamily)